MIGMNQISLPPPQLTDDALRLAGTLLAICADPIASKNRLDELTAATATLRDAIAQHDAAKVATDAAATALADLQQREQNLADRENALIAAQTRLNVSAGAIADRDEAVKLKEAASDRRAAALDAREQALAAKAEQWRAALA